MPEIKKVYKTHSMKSISRRSFLNRTAAGAAFIAIKPASDLVAYGFQKPGTWPSGATKYSFHMIGQAHIDPVWLWPLQEGISVVYSTFRSALDRMNETPDFAFTASSAQFYQWIADNDPDMLEEIRKRVDEGRWNIVGGWWVEPDVNIPCGESLVRHGLYGQLTFDRLLGHRATVAFNPDSFGHAGTLPQIFRLQGMHSYVFMRPGPAEKTIPADLFWWESADGSRILTYRIPLSYNDTGPVRNRIGQVLDQFRDEPVKSFMAFYGAGDHGGGATKENIRSIEELKTEKGSPAVFFSTPERYFKEIRQEINPDLPVVRDDLQHHAVGCYTAEMEIKKGNRQAEAALIASEKITSAGSIIWGASYPADEFTSAWKRILLLQFHDSMAGTSVPEHSRTAREGFGYAASIAGQSMYMALQKLESMIRSDNPLAQYLLVFNPHCWEVQSTVEYDFNWDTGRSSRVEDGQGNSLLHQWTGGSTETGNRKRLIASLKLPPFGYRQIRVLQGESQAVSSPAKASENSLENEFLRVRFSDSGNIGITDKENGWELFTGGAKGCRAVILNDPSDTWSHDIKSFTDESGEFSKASIKILESGPVRASIRVRTTYGASILTIDWSLCSGSRNLEARVTLDWHEHLKMLKFSFPADITAPSATYETPYGHIVRPTNGNEDPGQRWIDLSGKRNGNIFGFTVINDAKYGYSVSNNDLRISVARSPVYAHHKPRVLDMAAEHYWMDQGIHTFRMLLVPHKDTWQKANIPRTAEEFITPAQTIYQGIHAGSKPSSDSFISAEPAGIIVSAIKKAEKNNDLIIRCYETLGTGTSAIIDLHFIKRQWKGNFRPCEIKTLRVDNKTGEIRETNLLEE
jgi:alpha-mannosidase